MTIEETLPEDIQPESFKLWAERVSEDVDTLNDEERVTEHSELDGLDADDHTQYALADGSRGDFASSDQVSSIASDLSSHEDAGNPHSDSASNSDVQQVASDLSSHVGDTSNPHGVTAEQTGALRVVAGTYTGEQAGSQLISLPFQPVAWWITSSENHVSAAYFPPSDSQTGFYVDGDGVVQQGAGRSVVGEPESGGLRVGGQNDDHLNVPDRVYSYIALG